MNIVYNIGKSSIYEDEMHIICEEIIELLKTKNITFAVAKAILEETTKVLDSKCDDTNLQSFN